MSRLTDNRKTNFIIKMLIYLVIGLMLFNMSFYIGFTKIGPVVFGHKIGMATNEYDPREACVIITNGQGHGSGVHIGDGIILTAGHCIGIEGAWVEDYNGRTYAIVDQWKDPYGEDVGFIKIRYMDLPKLYFGDTVKVKDTIWVIGTPLNLCNSFNITEGIVTRVMTNMPGWWYDAMLIDAATYPGNSGGPVINKDNEIVGILVGGYMGYDSLNIVEPIADILWSLEDFLRYEKDK